MLNTLNGMRIITNDMHVVYDGEDWSGVRSISRARRRLKRGFSQNIKAKYKPSPDVIHDRINNVLHMHPATLKALQEKIEASQ